MLSVSMGDGWFRRALPRANYRTDAETRYEYLDVESHISFFSRNEWTTSRQPRWHRHLSSCRVVKMSFPQLQQTLVQNVDMLVGRCRPASCVMKRTKSERPVLMCQQVKVILRFANYYSRVTRWQLAKLSKEIQFFYTKY